MGEMENGQQGEALARWRLILGRFADDGIGQPLRGDAARMDAALEYLYDREYYGRGARPPKQQGGLGPSQLNVPHWLNEVRDLFPRETVEIVERHALQRYNMTELVTDGQVLERLEPSHDLLRAILTLKHLMRGEVLDTARRLVRQIVDDLTRRLDSDVRRVLRGKLNRFQRSPQQIAQNFDWRRTVRDNLKHFDPEQRRLIVQRVHFFSRIERHLPWHVILCVDQSGSMLDSVIHSAVMTGILAALPTVKVSLVVFDTTVVDLSGYVDDPVEALMSVQLGGGTNIAQALAYCETLVEMPHRTALVLVTDFYEGGSPQQLIATASKIREAGVRLLGLAALDPAANPSYDRQMAERLVAVGAEIAALTPRQLAEWLITVMR